MASGKVSKEKWGLCPANYLFIHIQDLDERYFLNVCGTDFGYRFREIWWSFKARQDLEWSEAGDPDREDDVTEGVNEKMHLSEYKVGGMKEVETEGGTNSQASWESGLGLKPMPR